MTARVVIACTTALAAVSVVLASTVPAPTPSRSPVGRPTVTPAPSSPSAGDSKVRGTDAHDRRALRRDDQLPTKALVRRRRDAFRSVRSFLDAYLPVDVGEQTPSRRQAVAATTTPRLASRLLAGSARDPGGPSRPGEVVGMTGEFDKPPTAFAARVLIDRNGVVSELGLIVVRGGGRWRIDDLTE